jgi:hypothetical protein
MRRPTAEVIDFEAARRELQAREDAETLPPVRYLWTCSCGSHLFGLTRTQILCALCGSLHDWRPEE